MNFVEGLSVALKSPSSALVRSDRRPAFPGSALLPDAKCAEDFPKHFLVIDTPEDVADCVQ